MVRSPRPSTSSAPAPWACWPTPKPSWTSSKARDPRRGKAVVYVHTTPEQLAAVTGADVARVEDIGPATCAMLANILGHDHITLKPVIDLNRDHRGRCV